MKTAVVTGVSSGIGLGICKMLIDMNYKVLGISRDFSSLDYHNDNFLKISCDITNMSKLVECIETIKNKEEINLLINNAGVGYFGPHEELNPAKIHAMVSTNLEAPLIITNILLRNIKKNMGTIINISSTAAKKVSTHGCAYAATKSGITHFSESLFEEVRKTGVKVVTIHPDMTKTNFYRNSDFEEGQEEDTYLTVETLVEAVRDVITLNPNSVITDITIKPQKHKIARKKINA